MMGLPGDATRTKEETRTCCGLPGDATCIAEEAMTCCGLPGDATRTGEAAMTCCGLPGDATCTGEEAMTCCCSGNGNTYCGVGGGDPCCLEGDKRNVGKVCLIGWICNGTVESCMPYGLAGIEPGGFISGGLVVGSLPARCAGDKSLDGDGGSCDWLVSREDEAARFPEHSSINEEDTLWKFRACVLLLDPPGIFFCSGIVCDNLAVCCLSSSKIPSEALVTCASRAAHQRFTHWQHQAGSTFLGSNA